MNIFGVVCLVGIIVTVKCNCPNGWMRHDSTCYHFGHDTEDWTGALTMCERMGGNLLEIGGPEEDKYIVSQVKVFKKTFWIGLSDVMKEGSWMWMVSNNPLESGSYTNWSPGQPSNTGNNENCAYISPTTGEWNDAQCHVPYNYICEKSDQQIGIVG